MSTTSYAKFFAFRSRSQFILWSALDLLFRGLSKTSNILIFQVCMQGMFDLKYKLLVVFHVNMNGVERDQLILSSPRTLRVQSYYY